ncbi:hypothetical protein EA84_01879 [Enterococcus faecium]|nr:hypothetical protein EA84_01879 [Enterococcus faecium]
MAREEALKIGKVIADNWWANSRSIILCAVRCWFVC